MLERLFVGSLTLYLEANNLLHSGPQSTISDLPKYDAVIAQFLNESRACDLLSIDFRCAFDQVDPGILCAKFNSIGVDGCYLDWIKDYITGRMQFVSYGGACSTFAALPSSVIPGSSIRPCAFIVFINDIYLKIKHAKSSLFANNYEMVGDVSTPADRQRLQKDVKAIVDWSIANRLPISFEKSVVLHYGSNNVKKYVQSGKVISSADSCKDVGVLKSSNFSYEEHARNTALKAARLAGMVLKVFSTCKPAF